MIAAIAGTFGATAVLREMQRTLKIAENAAQVAAAELIRLILETHNYLRAVREVRSGLYDYCECIKSLRQAANLMQRELADRVGISASMLSLVEAGKREPTISLCVASGRALESQRVSSSRSLLLTMILRRTHRPRKTRAGYGTLGVGGGASVFEAKVVRMIRRDGQLARDPREWLIEDVAAVLGFPSASKLDAALASISDSSYRFFPLEKRNRRRIICYAAFAVDDASARRERARTSCIARFAGRL
jgi:DNA-binding XRE family transcriptional regulator